MEEFSVDQLSRLVSSIAGQTMANEALLSVLIATHPNPSVLRGVWHAAKPELVDEQADRLLFQRDRFREAFLMRLSALTGEVDAAADAA